MIPESGEVKSVRLCKAIEFPNRWAYLITLLEGMNFLDNSVVYYGDKWWLFTETSQRTSDTLRFFYANDLHGPWTEHARSPLINGSPHEARPAGRFMVLSNHVIRLAQDCEPCY